MKKDPLAEIDIVEVARIAASISIPGLSDFARIREAYRLLKRASDVRSEASRAGLPLWEVITEEERRLNAKPVFRGRTLSLAEFLKQLMPKVEKAATRKRRFIEFLGTGKGDRKSVEAVLAKYESEGVASDEIFRRAVPFQTWWDGEYKSQKSKAGKTKKGDAAETAPPDVLLKLKADKPPKGKQGRVIRKNDKRKGARR
jgi:hypothetical protein